MGYDALIFVFFFIFVDVFAFVALVAAFFAANVFTGIFAFNNGNILRIAFPFRKCHEAAACNHCHTQHDGQCFL